MKARLLVLKRVRAGDQDLLIKGYSHLGMVDLFVKNGLIPESEFFGIFEPFNLVSVDVYQQGGIVIPRDIFSVKRFSLLCRDYYRYMWMSWVSGFVLRNVGFYESRLFNMFVSYMLDPPAGDIKVSRIKLMIDFLNLSGLRPKLFEQEVRKERVSISLLDGSISKEGETTLSYQALKLLKIIDSSKRLGKFRADIKTLSSIEKFLQEYISYHTR